MTDFSAMVSADRGQPAAVIERVETAAFDGWIAGQSARVRAAAAAARFVAKPYTHLLLPGDAPDQLRVVVGVGDDDATWSLAGLPAALPAGSYRLTDDAPGTAALGWLLGQYRFDRYRKADDAAPRCLLVRKAATIDATLAMAAAIGEVRDLVNLGAGDLGPAEIEAHADALARAHGATLTVTRGDTLARDYPMIHAVGQAATRDRAPRLVELEWGDPAHPRVAIVGKGVVFDTGGLDIKPASGMRLMKKDMGGAAHALALARLVMAAGLKLRLHVLVPAVENAISAGAFRPGDVLRTRAGLTVENNNTDAEGRLILGDALTRAGEERPALVIDFATLTGAARVALGPDLPPLFANDDGLADELIAAGRAADDPLWRMPLWDGYDDMLKSDIADLVNAPEGGFAGAVTAALFLRRFVPKGTPWAHLDVFAWRPAAKPGRPKGGDAFGLRATFEMLQTRYS